MANAYLPALDEYVPVLHHLTVPGNRHLSPTQIRPTEGDWPEFQGHRVCQDATGRWREHHSFVIDGREGRECVFCGLLRRTHVVPSSDGPAKEPARR